MGQDQQATAAGRILVVCTGNVCRSPYIERRLSQLVSGLGITVTSRGTRALAGEPMDRAVAAALRDRDCGTDGFVARQLQETDLDEADLVITAAREHRAEVVRMSPQSMARCFALLDLADLAASADSSYYGSAAPGDSWVRHVTARIAARRGMVPPRAAADADVVDPMGLGSRVCARMVREIESGLPAVAAGLMPASALTSRR